MRRLKCIFGHLAIIVLARYLHLSELIMKFAQIGVSLILYAHRIISIKEFRPNS